MGYELPSSGWNEAVGMSRADGRFVVIGIFGVVGMFEIGVGADCADGSDGSDDADDADGADGIVGCLEFTVSEGGFIWRTSSRIG